MYKSTHRSIKVYPITEKDVGMAKEYVMHKKKLTYEAN